LHVFEPSDPERLHDDVGLSRGEDLLPAKLLRLRERRARTLRRRIGLEPGAQVLFVEAVLEWGERRIRFGAIELGTKALRRRIAPDIFVCPAEPTAARGVHRIDELQRLALFAARTNREEPARLVDGTI